MATTAVIRAAIVAKLDGTYKDWQTSAYFLANPTPPCIDVRPDGTDYDAAMAGGLNVRTFLVRAIVGLTTDIGTQEKLDELLDGTGATSMKAVLEDVYPQTLGGVIQDLSVTDASGYKVYPVVGSTEVLGVEFTVMVYP